MTRAHYISIATGALTLVIALTLGGGSAELRPVGLSVTSLRIPTVLVLGGGIVMGMALVRAFAEWTAWPDGGGVPARKLVDRTLIPTSLIAAIYFGGAASVAGSVPPVRIAIILALITAALLSGYRCLDALGRGEAIGVESHWGGLGGGSGGWRLLPTTVMAFLTLTFTSAAIIVALAEPSPSRIPAAGPSPATTPSPTSSPSSTPTPVSSPGASRGGASNATIPAGNAAEPPS